MAQPVQFEGVNCTYVAEGCGDLPVIRDNKEIVSCWEFTPEEIEIIRNTGRVYLHIVGNMQPPVYAGVYHPVLYKPLISEEQASVDLNICGYPHKWIRAKEVVAQHVSVNSADYWPNVRKHYLELGGEFKRK